ncbi:phosphomannomutase [Williamsia sp. Leaf354]|uniref:phospho-sugar mutase n=1 Tax=Williamsia sp. Leaf354 TaxID=1736349 RepID=UPI0006FC40F1|nr:phospho-sugar mutase [Williamsia sp. Leaf354]KQR97293.1 phosphomannomutase [Williamsia sp. Leaf354]
MTSNDTTAVEAWIAADPDPVTRDELTGLDPTALAQRFADRLHFGTAGLRGPVRGGPNGMNRLVVIHTTTALADWLIDAGHAGGSVVVGHDARHGSHPFAADAAGVLRDRGFDVIAFATPVPTPVVAFTTRRFGAVAGVMITASHNPPADNGYKVYLGGGPMDAGAQIIPPVDAEIEERIARMAVDALVVPATGAPVTDPRAVDAVEAYLSRLLERHGSRSSTLRVALTPMHGVGGDLTLRALAAAGVTDVVVVDEQFAPDPDFPTVAFPNPEEPGAADLLLDLAARSNADIAIALDPDADRCAVGAVVDGAWRMLTGDETGALLSTAALSQHDSSTDAGAPLVATTIVSSTLLGRIADAAGALHTRTLTGFKWLVRAGEGLRYAYEEAIGHCVDPDAVRDKDGISAAVALAVLAHERNSAGQDLAAALDELFARHGVHRTGQVSVRTDTADDITAIMTRLRTRPPATLCGVGVARSDFATRTDHLRTDAVEFTGHSPGHDVRVIVRPSGTEPKVKFYLEVVVAAGGPERLDEDKRRADILLDDLRVAARELGDLR